MSRLRTIAAGEATRRSSLRWRHRTDPRSAGPSRRHAAAILALIVTISLAFAAGAARAHEDLPIVDATVTLAPGERVEFPTAIHYHRIVGRYDVSGSDADVSLALASTQADGFDALLVAAATSGTLNELIRCCDGRTWTEAALVARNDGTGAARLRLRAWAVHDDFAVVVDRAETGAASVPLAIFLALGLTATGVGWRVRRLGLGRVTPGRTPASLRWSAGLSGVALAIAVGLGAAGMLRYGAGPVDGMVAVLADVPVPGGPFGSRDALVMGILLLAWSTAIGFWIRSLHVGAHRTTTWAVRLGLALGIISLIGGVAMGVTYGRPAVPLLLGAVLAVPLVGVALALRIPNEAEAAAPPPPD